MTATDTPVVVRIRRTKAVAFAIPFLLLSLAGLFHFVLFARYVGPLDSITIVGLCVTLGFGAICTYFGAIAVRRPVALRMDRHGISGYYADPATWDEITEIAAFSGSKGARFLGFTLQDPVGFRDRQTPWRRYTSWAAGRGTGHHIIVPQSLLKDADVDALARAAQALHSAHDSVT